MAVADHFDPAWNGHLLDCFDLGSPAENGQLPMNILAASYATYINVFKER